VESLEVKRPEAREEVYKKSRAAVVKAKQRVQLPKIPHTHIPPYLEGSSVSFSTIHPVKCLLARNGRVQEEQRNFYLCVIY
jgi:hypothetical protein